MLILNELRYWIFNLFYGRDEHRFIFTPSFFQKKKKKKYKSEKEKERKKNFFCHLNDLKLKIPCEIISTMARINFLFVIRIANIFNKWIFISLIFHIFTLSLSRWFAVRNGNFFFHSFLSLSPSPSFPIVHGKSVEKI